MDQLESREADKETLVALKEISSTVQKVCQFGGSNYHKPRQLTSLVAKLVEATLTPCAIVRFSENLMAAVDHNERTALKETVEIIINTPFFGINYKDLDKYFRSTEKGTYINPSVIHRILNYMHDIDDSTDNEENKKKFEFLDVLKQLQKFDLEDFKPFIAFLTYQWTIKVKMGDKFYQNKEKMLAIGINFLLQEKTKPKNLEDCRLVLEYIAHDVRHSAFYFSMGNCQIMAELAFLMAIQQIKNNPIHYIQFVDTKEGTEELNAIVIGQWPQPGCLVLAPWYSNNPFAWQGTFSKTPGLKCYTKGKPLFSVNNENERIRYSKQLTKLDFNVKKLLEDTNRKQYFDYITSTSEKAYYAANPKVVKAQGSEFQK